MHHLPGAHCPPNSSPDNRYATQCEKNDGAGRKVIPRLLVLFSSTSIFPRRSSRWTNGRRRSVGSFLRVGSVHALQLILVIERLLPRSPFFWGVDAVRLAKH